MPATSTSLRALLETGAVGPAPVTAFAVTPGLREWYTDGDIEELEYAASMEAARASLRLIDLDPRAARRRVVIAVDLPDRVVEARDDLDRGVVRSSVEVRLADVASIHIDDADAVDTVARAAASIIEADLGDEEAELAVGDTEGFELSWYASQELTELLDSL